MQPFGFLNINKPKGITSFDVIFKLRKILGIKKIGHTGTLDPLATGVLPIAVGNAARLIEFLEDDKKYIATIKFGEISTTYDEEGEKKPVAMPNFSRAQLEKTLLNFEGKILQTPPIYSAIKVDGKKLYELARSGKEVEIQPREIEIYSISVLDFIPPDVAKIEIHCSKGTYIRSLAYDMGQKLKCGAYLADLERTKAGKFEIKNSISIEDVTNTTFISPAKVLPFKQYELNEEDYNLVKCGNSITPKKTFIENETVILTYHGQTVAIGTQQGDVIKVGKVFNLCH